MKLLRNTLNFLFEILNGKLIFTRIFSHFLWFCRLLENLSPLISSCAVLREFVRLEWKSGGLWVGWETSAPSQEMNPTGYGFVKI